nr:extracellular solute-binding protein [Bacillota bacterium]
MMVFSSLAMAADITINLVTAGDQNMVDLFNMELGPLFAKENPGYRVRVVGTGPGDPGSQQIVEKLLAQKRANRESWDIDVAVIHEIGASLALQEELLSQYAESAATFKYVTSSTAKTALGVDVEGYVIPMFHSQTVLAYNPNYIEEPPKSFEELVEWVKENPGKFGYNGIKQGASGVSFVASWLYWKTGNYDIYAVTGPFDEKYMESWEQALAELREFDSYVTMTSGNAATLDMLSRGEIWIGPVWVDMFYSWVADGRMNPDFRLCLPAPGMCGQPMYYVIPAKAANPEAALKFIEFVTSPEIQAKYIVEKFNWYPGIDASYVQEYLPQETWNMVFRDVGPEELANYARVFPIKDYYQAMMEAYEHAMR